MTSTTSTRQDSALAGPTNPTHRYLAAGGLVVAAAGIGLQKWAGVDMPTVPPSVVVLAVAALVLVTARRGRWPRVLALVVLVAEALGFVGSGSITELAGSDGFDVTAATSVRLAGILLAAAFLIPRRTAERRGQGVVRGRA